MARQKRKRAVEIKTLPNVLENPEHIKGRWLVNHFGNDNPIVLELGCGDGIYTLELAQRFPGKNFIGIDIKPDRIWRGAIYAIENNLSNVLFLKILIQFIPAFFEENEVSEIWITFPDPYPKNRQIKHRLVSPRFLPLYQKILKPGGIIHLKTDVDYLFDYTIELLEKVNCKIHKRIDDLYNSEADDELLSIRTPYETKYSSKGHTIKYVCFSFT